MSYVPAPWARLMAEFRRGPNIPMAEVPGLPEAWTPERLATICFSRVFAPTHRLFLVKFSTPAGMTWAHLTVPDTVAGHTKALMAMPPALAAAFGGALAEEDRSRRVDRWGYPLLPGLPFVRYQNR